MRTSINVRVYASKFAFSICCNYLLRKISFKVKKISTRIVSSRFVNVLLNCAHVMIKGTQDLNNDSFVKLRAVILTRQHK